MPTDPRPEAPRPVALEVVQDRTAEARCDEGFLRVKRLICRSRREDGSRSEPFPVDLVDREHLDAVGVLVWRRGAAGPELLLRDCLRPGAFFRKDREPPVPEGEAGLFVQEIVAGILEAEDRGLEGVRRRAAIEVLEEAGFRVAPEEIVHLGAPFYLVPGTLSEKVHLTAVEVTGRPRELPEGDGSPMEEGGRITWIPLAEVQARSQRGELQDAKTELGAHRLLLHLAGEDR
ncbi:MAG: NUDIX hydrolase [Deltaproteobacteria bacterium]|nr:NUDIX hydrolase [Deltaproteobacteria bacterium]